MIGTTFWNAYRVSVSITCRYYTVYTSRLLMRSVHGFTDLIRVYQPRADNRTAIDQSYAWEKIRHYNKNNDTQCTQL